MEIFSTPEAFLMGPVQLPELLKDSNQRIVHLTNRLQEKERGLDEMRSLVKNERNRRLTAQSSLDEAKSAQEQLEFSLNLAKNKIWMLERRISVNTCKSCRVSSKISESCNSHGGQSVFLLDSELGVTTTDVSSLSLGSETGNCSVPTNAIQSKLNVSNVTLSDKDHTEQGPSKTRQPRFRDQSLASGRLCRKRFEAKSRSDLRQTIQEMLERERLSAKLLCEETGAMIDDLNESLRVFARLRSGSQTLGEPGAGGNELLSLEHNEGYYSKLEELSNTRQMLWRLFEEEIRIRGVQSNLARLRLSQIIHEQDIEHEMRVFIESAFCSDSKREDTEVTLMAFSHATGYRLKLARMIWDKAAHSSKNDVSADKDHSDTEI